MPPANMTTGRLGSSGKLKRGGCTTLIESRLPAFAAESIILPRKSVQVPARVPPRDTSVAVVS